MIVYRLIENSFNREQGCFVPDITKLDPELIGINIQYYRLLSDLNCRYRNQFELATSFTSSIRVSALAVVL